MSNTRLASGAVANHWLSDVFSNDWTHDPFPANSVRKIIGKRVKSDITSYWLRVDFSPQHASQIVASVRSDFRPEGIDEIAVQDHQTVNDPDPSSMVPQFYRPENLGVSKTTIEVLRGSSAGGGITRTVIVIVSKDRGIAYIRRW